MASENNITLTVVVSGAPQQVRVNVHQKVAELMQEALRESGRHGADLVGWVLTFATSGESISPEARVGEAGITAGATLFLNKEAGGGGAIAAPLEAPTSVPELVDQAVSAKKLGRELEAWAVNEEIYRERGWILLGHDGLEVDVAFTVRLAVGQFADVPLVPLAVRVSFENYDLWAPSVRVIDPLTRRWLQVPRVPAIDFRSARDGGEALNLFVLGHPESGHAFLCLPGVREYHRHPEHSGDDWLLHRGEGEGTLPAICEALWQTAVRTVTGLNFVNRRILVGDLAQIANQVELRQEDVDQAAAELRAQMPVAGEVQMAGQVPPEILAQLGLPVPGGEAEA
jgi:hypothetical protein